MKCVCPTNSNYHCDIARRASRWTSTPKRRCPRKSEPLLLADRADCASYQASPKPESNPDYVGRLHLPQVRRRRLTNPKRSDRTGHADKESPLLPRLEEMSLISPLSKGGEFPALSPTLRH